MATDERNEKWAGAPRAAAEDESLANLNPFDRAEVLRARARATAGKTSTPENDWKNRFERHQEVIDGQRRDTAAHAARIQHREDNRRRWNRQSEPPKTATGMAMDPSLASLRDKAEQTRLTAKQPPIVIDIPTLRAVVSLWRTESPDGIALYQNWEENDWNREMLARACQFHIANGAAITVALAQAAYDTCVEGGHLDPKKRRDREGNIVRKRGETLSQLPPVEFPRVIWNDERQANEAAEHERAVAAAEAATQQALSMPFDQLQTSVRKNYKPTAPTTAVMGR